MATEIDPDFPTDKELEDILLSDDTPTRQVKDPTSNEPTLDLKHLSKKKGPTKLKRNKSKGKKKQGRPVIWTPEKKAKDLAERKVKSQQKREKKKHLEQLTKLSLNQSFNPAERKRLTNAVQKSKEDLENDILQRREEEKRIQGVTDFTPICNHIDKFSYIDMAGYFVSACMYCSRSKKWDPKKWDVYWSKTKKELKHGNRK